MQVRKLFKGGNYSRAETIRENTVHIYFFDLPVNGANTRHIIMSAYAFAEKPVSNFPGKHGGVILLVLCNRINNMGRGYFGFAATDHTGFVIASLIEPAKKERYRASKQVHSVGKVCIF